jgi:DNA-binding response OmpR family regulator
MSGKILYVEDEPFLARIVSDGLKSSGYMVDVVADGNQVTSAYQSLKPDLCILDIMLPSKDGYTIARELRMLDPGLPIIFLSAKSLTEDVIAGFKAGGDDYLKKPFSLEELLVRIQALLRRSNPNSPELNEQTTKIITFGNCSLDVVHQRLITLNGEFALSYKETVLLEMMLRKRNEVLTRQEALLKIWGDDSYYNTRSMDVFMTHIRKLLKDEAGVQILNVRGLGFKLLC